MINKIKLSVIVASTITLALSCGETTFNSGSSVKSSEEDKSESAGGDNNGADAVGESGDPVTEVLRTFKKTETGKTDILWVLDNSGSMGNEVTQVSKNMLAFFNKMKSYADARVGVISGIGTGTKLSVPAEIREDLIISNTTVSSTNALQKTGEFLAGPGKFFYRKSASKILVVVTDDQSAVTPEAFSETLKGFIDPKDFKLFGFIGTSESKCSIARVGQQYIDLAATTSGKIFDICAEDWSENFDLLADSIIDTVKAKYEVSKVIKSIKSITIGGVAVPEDKYSFVNKTITIAEELISDSDLEIKIEYVVK